MPSSPPVRVSFLGGLGEIGRNMATIEVDGEIAVVDCGVLFPDAEHLGVDLILPDWGWMKARAGDVRAVFLTHGHLDHIGALPYLLRDLQEDAGADEVPVVYGTRLTIAFVKAILEEWPDLERPEFVEVEPGETIEEGPFNAEVVQVSHSIPDGCAYAFRTPHGMIVHTGDFKLDQTPIDGRPTDLAHFARLGDEGVDLLLADSTNADRAGHVPTERTVGRVLREEIQPGHRAGRRGLVRQPRAPHPAGARRGPRRRPPARLRRPVDGPQHGHRRRARLPRGRPLRPRRARTRSTATTGPS